MTPARLLLLSLLLVACRSAPVRPEPEPRPELPQNFVELENRRSIDPELLSQLALSAPEEDARARAFLAIARLQDPSFTDTIRRGLADVSPKVRAEAAFAVWSLGLSWHPLDDATRRALAEAVLEREALEADPKVRGRMLRALGRIGTPEANRRLVERLAGDHVGVRTSAGLALGVAIKRGDALPENALAALAPLVTTDTPEPVRFGATYALSFVKKPEALPLLLQVVADPDPEIRLLAVKGIGAIGCVEHARLGKALDDPDWRVSVEASRALATCGDEKALLALKALEKKPSSIAEGKIAAGAQPLLAFAQAKLSSGSAPLIAQIRKTLATAAKGNTAHRSELGNVDCRLAAAEVSLTGDPAPMRGCGFDSVEESWKTALGLRALASAKTLARPNMISEHALSMGSPHAAVRSAALELLLAHAPPDTLAPLLRKLLREDDLPLAAAAAKGLSNLKSSTPAERAADVKEIQSLLTKLPQAPDIADPVLQALVELEGAAAETTLRTLLRSPHAHVRNTAATQLTSLTKQHVVAPLIASAETHRFALLAPGSKLRVRTAKGDFLIALFVEDAPYTSATIGRLAEQGYFKSLTFHRVVPDFVVQGGDPRGDGEGGPGFTQRCEVSARPYFGGTVGMALAGKDTGGSQFFVTHSPQPHLEGRYPVFGQIEQGQEVVDALLESDRILDVELLQP